MDKFAPLNPKKRVPVLSLDNEVITEVSTIVAAIAKLAPDRCLMLQTAVDRVRVCEWTNRLSGTLTAPGFGGFWWPQQFSYDPETFKSIRA